MSNQEKVFWLVTALSNLLAKQGCKITNKEGDITLTASNKGNGVIYKVTYRRKHMHIPHELYTGNDLKEALAYLEVDMPA